MRPVSRLVSRAPQLTAQYSSGQQGAVLCCGVRVWSGAQYSTAAGERTPLYSWHLQQGQAGACQHPGVRVGHVTHYLQQSV